MATSYNDILEAFDKRAQEAYSIYETCPVDELQIPIENSATENQRFIIGKLRTILSTLNPKQCFGSSTCRLCHRSNGSCEYEIDNFIIPEGYIHYLEVHYVKIDERLKNYLMEHPFGEKPSKKTYIGYWKPYQDFVKEEPIPQDQDYTYKPIDIQKIYNSFSNKQEIDLDLVTARSLELIKQHKREQQQELQTLPFPIENTRTPDHDLLLSKLQILINTIDKKNVIQYKGMSKCRICDKFNGSQEYRIANFCIPEGYIHYLQVHNVGMDERLREYLLYGKLTSLGRMIRIGYWSEKPKQEEESEYIRMYSTNILGK